MQTRTFHARPSKWILSVIPVVILSGISLLLYLNDLLPPCLGLFLLLALINLFSTWQLQIKFTETFLSARMGFNRIIKIPWQDILMIQYIRGERNNNYLQIGTSEGFFQINLQPFEADLVWQEILNYIPPTALEEAAYQKIPAYQSWVEEKAHLVTNIRVPFQVGYSSSTAITMFLIWAAFIGVGLAILIGLEIKTPLAWVFYGVLGISSGLPFAESMVTRIELNSEKIKLTNLWGYKEIKWKEVHTIENRGRRLRFLGPHKELAVIRPHLWYGKNRDQAIKMIYAQIEDQKIAVVDKQVNIK